MLPVCDCAACMQRELDAELDAIDSIEAAYKDVGFDDLSPIEQRFADGDR